MGIFGAMTTAISGLKAQSFALERISDNIANSQTTAYKRSDATFADYVPDSPSNQQALGVVVAFSRPTNGIQGDLANVDTPTYMAINGSGFFVVAEQTSSSDGQPVFSTDSLYTRRGDFTLNRDGYLVNATGYYLKGLPLDPTTGNPSGSQPDVIKVSTDFIAAVPTTTIDYRANLASYPKTATADPAIPNSELINPADFATDPTTAGGSVSGAEASTFVEQSISGGAITAYDAAGASVNVQLRWAKTDSVTNGGTDKWQLFYLSDSSPTATAAWKNAGTTYEFGANGQLNPSIPSITLTGLTVNGTALGDVTVTHGASGITQFADSNGTAKVTEISQNGSAAGELAGVFVSDQGRITARYTNGRSVELAEVTLANFQGESGLQRTDGGAFKATPDSGAPILGSLGTVVGGALESSNTDIADEFTKLIVTQQAYSANTRIITTGDEMLQEALNMIR